MKKYEYSLVRSLIIDGKEKERDVIKLKESFENIAKIFFEYAEKKEIEK